MEPDSCAKTIGILSEKSKNLTVGYCVLVSIWYFKFKGFTEQLCRPKEFFLEKKVHKHWKNAFTPIVIKPVQK